VRNYFLISNSRRLAISVLAMTGFLNWAAGPLPAANGAVKVGAGSYVTQPPPGAHIPPREILRTENVTGKMPTNDWWSALAWKNFGDNQFPHPLAVSCSASGLRIAYPNLVGSAKAIFGSMPGPGGEDIALSSSKGSSFPDAKIDGFSDWFIRVRFGNGEESMKVSYGHGSPYVYAVFPENAAAKLAFSQPPKVWSGNAKSPVLGITVNNHHYGLFGPAGSTWEGIGTNTLTNVTGGKPYFSLAVLPDGNANTLALFRKYAYSHVTDTHVTWKYDPASADVTTTFSFTTRPYEGNEKGTLFALYPHQWRHTKAPLAGGAYTSVRGTMKLAAGESFTTTVKFTGVLPALPRMPSVDAAKVAAYIDREPSVKKGPGDFADTYWEGKSLGRQTALAVIADEYGLAKASQRFEGDIRQRLQQWFTATEPNGQSKATGLFYYDDLWGSLIGYPASYGSDDQLNDHHFHYGYFIRAAAEVARVNPKWASDSQYGGMVKLLIRDIASPDRDDKQFPFLRTFDPYAGHSWAAGPAKFADGNNQESSSEAMDAWYGMILWGDATGDQSIRDLGIWLYTTEKTAVDEYWFDTTGENFPKGFAQAALGMVWGGKGDHGTWFSGEPEAVYGINWLPMQAGSLYLGEDVAYANRSYAALKKARGSDQWKMWSDLMWMYRALSDADDAMRQFNAAGEGRAAEAGNSLANTYQWIAALQALGHVDATVTADYPLAVVFKKGNERSYVAYNGGKAAIAVKFSDGFTLKAPPGKTTVGSKTAAR
jgi:endoglucanase Acf2